MSYEHPFVFAPLTVPFGVEPEDTQADVDHKVRGHCKTVAYEAAVEHGVRVGWRMIREWGLISAVHVARKERSIEWTDTPSDTVAGFGPSNWVRHLGW